ncbi:VirD4-like conjugal transfer protein, CD1115 family [Lactococcus lactis]|uniref:TraG family protein n=2 Tax=Lactococcus lactis TaxID=1358 RepID=A0A0V8E536_LACLL|nr:type IV secretory system conjugative DNA transfer family protein [Lactococcus lactis]KSU20948.1 TraG family protein [Lactococcus lactis subsp. lactis]
MANKKSIIPHFVLGIVIGYLVNRIIELYQSAKPPNQLIAAMEFPQAIMQHPLSFSLEKAPIWGFLGTLVLIVLMYFLRDSREYMPGAEYGTDRFATPREKKLFANKNKWDNIILGNGLFKSLSELSNAMFQRNNNVMLIGGAGSWKTTSFSMSNIAQMNCSFLMTDPKGQTIHKVGAMLESHGYKVLQVDFDTLKNTDHFNPFAYIHDEVSLKKVIKMLIDATNADHEKKGEPFWDKAEELLITALMAYLYYRYRGDGVKPGDGVMPNLAQVGEMIRLLKRKDPDVKSTLENMFDRFAVVFGKDNYAYLQWENFKNNFEGKTHGSILAISITRFSIFDLKQVKEFIADDNLEIEKWCTEKYAVFLKIPDIDDTFNFLPLMVFYLAFRILENKIDNDFNGESPIPIQFFMDEFANLGKVPLIKEVLSVFRSRKMSVVIMLQNINQLVKVYKDDWKSFFGTCDSWVYLSGSTEPETTKWFSEAAGNKTIYKKTRDRNGIRSEPMKREVIQQGEVGNLPRKKALVKIASFPMFKVDKYNYKKHPNAKYFAHKPTDKNWYEVKRYKDALEAYNATHPTDNETIEIEWI